MRPDITIIVATHKKYRMPDDHVYLPLHVGAEGKIDENGASLSFGYEKDNNGDNISSLNWCFGTQTALYWAWKNLRADYVGLVHYRRYFLSRKPQKGEDVYQCILTGKEIAQLMQRYRVILPKKRHYYIESVFSHYSHTINGGKEQLSIVHDIIAQDYPEYLSVYEKFMKQRSAYIFNMMIMEKSLFDDYCSWLFPILFNLFEKFDTTGMNSFDRRYAGRVSERLLNVWLAHKIEVGVLRKEDIMEVPYTEDVKWFSKGISFLQAKIFKKKYSGSF